MLKLKKFPGIPVSTREEARESRPHPEEPRFCLSSRGCILSLRGPERIPGVPFASPEEALPQERREELQGRATFPEPPDVSVHSRETCFPCTASTFKPRIDSHHGGTWDCPVGKLRGKASWESLVGKHRGKASSESHRSPDPLEGKSYTAATAREESVVAYPHSRRGLTPLGRHQKNPKIHVGTGKESSGSSTDSTQGLRHRHRRERNPERSPSNTHGDWPFLRPPERVPEDPVVSREHLPQLEKIQEVLPCRRDEADFR